MVVGEYGLVLEELPALAQDKPGITDQERSDMLALACRMKMDDLVPRALGSAHALGMLAELVPMWPMRVQGTGSAEIAVSPARVSRKASDGCWAAEAAWPNATGFRRLGLDGRFPFW